MSNELFNWGCSTALFTAIAWYRSKEKQQNIEKLKEAPTLDINADLKDVLRETPDHSLPYVVIEGKVAAIGEALQSKFVPGMLGVIQTIILKEHKTVWDNKTKLWYDCSRPIEETTKVVPFSLQAVDASVTVVEPLNAKRLVLDTVYNNFSPPPRSFGYPRPFLATGEIIKGYQDIENLLPVGTVLTGIGKLTLEKDEVLLGPPTGNGEYILSALNKSQVMEQMDFDEKLNKALMYICGTCTAVIAVACLWRWYKNRARN